MKILVSVQILALFVAGAFSQALPQAKPSEVGLSSERLERIMTMLHDDAAKGTIPGAVLLVARHGKIAWFETTGVLNPETKAPMARDAIFRIYSMSKPITSVAAMTLVEDGKISLSDPLQRYIPSFARMQVGVEKDGRLEMVPARRPITIQDLLRHTSGLTYGIFGVSMVKKMYNEAGVLQGDFTNAEFAERIARLPLIYQPGTTWEYSHSTDILGRVVEVAGGKPLYEYEKERILGPLGMRDTGFYVTDTARRPRIAEPLSNDRAIGIGATFGDPRIPGQWESGGGGMVSTTMDYARFLQMLLNGGTLSGKRILGPKTIAYMTSDQLTDGIVPGPLYIPGPGYGFGLGFAVRRTAGGAIDNGSPGDYTWNGVGGTHFWVDPKEDLFVVFMIQSPRQRAHYMAVIRDMVYAAIER